MVFKKFPNGLTPDMKTIEKIIDDKEVKNAKRKKTRKI